MTIPSMQQNHDPKSQLQLTEPSDLPLIKHSLPGVETSSLHLSDADTEITPRSLNIAWLTSQPEPSEIGRADFLVDNYGPISLQVGQESSMAGITLTIPHDSPTISSKLTPSVLSFEEIKLLPDPPTQEFLFTRGTGTYCFWSQERSPKVAEFASSALQRIGAEDLFAHVLCSLEIVFNPRKVDQSIRRLAMWMDLIGGVGLAYFDQRANLICLAREQIRQE